MPKLMFKGECQNSKALKWDERVGAYRGPAYLLREIQEDLIANKVEFELPRIKLTPPNISKCELPLRPYQEAALDAWEIAGRRGVLCLPTGSGKTHIAIGAIRRTARPTLVLVPTRVLLQQWIGVLNSKAGIQAGVLGDGTRDIQAVTIATFESAYRHMSWLGDHFELLIVDEVHHFGAGIRDEALEMSLAQFRLGLTATAPADENWLSRITNLVGAVVYEIVLSELRGNYLSDFELIRVHLELNQDERAYYDREINAFRTVHRAFRELNPYGSWKDFVFYAFRSEAGRAALQSLRHAQKILSFPHAKREALARILARHPFDKKLIFTADTATAYEISRIHLVMPLTAEISRKEREDALDWFRKGEISTLVSCQVLNEGLDVPDASVAIILGGKRGEREHLQRIGRILRKKEGRTARIYELVCNRTLEVRQANKKGQNLDL